MEKKKFIAIVLFLCFGLFAEGQNVRIGLGKRKNIIWGRRIEAKNLGSIYTYYYPIYFETNQTSYQRIGILGDKLVPYMAQNETASLYFKKYRTSKITSYLLLGGTIAALGGWTYSAAHFLADHNNAGINPFFDRRRLPLLGLYFVGFYTSIYFNLEGDRQLKKAVANYNRCH